MVLTFQVPPTLLPMLCHPWHSGSGLLTPHHAPGHSVTQKERLSQATLWEGGLRTSRNGQMSPAAWESSDKRQLQQWVGHWGGHADHGSNSIGSISRYYPAQPLPLLCMVVRDSHAESLGLYLTLKLIYYYMIVHRLLKLSVFHLCHLQYQAHNSIGFMGTSQTGQLSGQKVFS